MVVSGTKEKGRGGHGYQAVNWGDDPRFREGRGAFRCHPRKALRSGRTTGRCIFRAPARLRESAVPQGFPRRKIKSPCRKTGRNKAIFIRVRLFLLRRFAASQDRSARAAASFAAPAASQDWPARSAAAPRTAG